MNYIKTSIKFIQRNKFFSAINILGLSIALAVSFIMLLYVINELSFDSMHKHKDNVYRVINYYKEFGHKLSGTPYPLAEDLKESFPQVERASNTRRISQFAIKVNDNWIRTNTLASTSDIFEIFTLPLISQNTETENLLESPDNIVISKKIAKLAFKQENPIGKQIVVFLNGKEHQCNVVGIYETLPENSSLQADCFINSKWGVLDLLDTFKDAETSYEVDFWKTWFKVADNQSINDMINEINDFCKKHNVSTEEHLYSFQNLNDFYLHSDDIYNTGKTGNLSNLRFVAVIILLILTVATFNYITLSTAISTNRAKEIGIRKTNGAGIMIIRRQLLSESVLMSLVSLPIAVFLMFLVIPYAEILFEVQLSFIDSNIILYVAFFVLLTVLIGLFSGLYSSYYLSKFKAIDVLNKKPFMGRKKHTLRNLLIVFQLVVFCVFVTSAFIVQSQYKYAINKDLGYNSSNMLYINLEEDIDYHLFLEQVKKMSPVISVGCAMDVLPTLDASSFMLEHFTEKNKKVQVEGLDVHYNYLETIGVKLKEGRYFSEDFGSDLTNAVILNQQAVKDLGIENPIGKKIGSKTIIGITEDFILHSIHNKVPPLYIELQDKYIFQMAVHYKQGQFANLLSLLQTEWAKIYQDTPMQYVTSEDLKQEIYLEEQNLFRMVTIGGVFTLLIAMLGLLGITLFVVQSRTKEIGIRKIVGSSTSSVVLMFLKGTVYKVIIASIVAIPITYFLMEMWLKTYAFRVNINWAYFFLTFVIALTVVVLTIIGQAYKVASKNPIDALRYE